MEATLRKSHVIPEWLYTPLYAGFNGTMSLTLGWLPTAEFEQKGFRERLLCQSCETKFSVYERYARGVLFGGQEITVVKHGEGIELRGLDYMKLKVFQLSLLWRPGVARQDFFSKVNLDRDEEPIRKCYWEATPENHPSMGAC